jgi:hypothetical protein
MVCRQRGDRRADHSDRRERRTTEGERPGAAPHHDQEVIEMRHMPHTSANRLAGAVAMGAMVLVATSAVAVAEADTDTYPAVNVSLGAVLDGSVEWSLADIYAGYADADGGSTEQPDADVPAGTEGRVEWSIADIYAGYADTHTVVGPDGDR